MPVGTRSLLFGIHQFLFHPILVFISWWHLYGFPWNPRLWAAFVVHDWGYWGKSNMDGEEGERHVLLGAEIMWRLFGKRGQKKLECKWYRLCRWHSRFWITKDLETISKPVFLETMHLCTASDNGDPYGEEAPVESVKRWKAQPMITWAQQPAQIWFSIIPQPSKLCYADKWTIVIAPRWLQIFLSRLSGELYEYRNNTSRKVTALAPENLYREEDNGDEWFDRLRVHLRQWVLENGDTRLSNRNPGGLS